MGARQAACPTSLHASFSRPTCERLKVAQDYASSRYTSALPPTPPFAPSLPPLFPSLFPIFFFFSGPWLHRAVPPGPQAQLQRQIPGGLWGRRVHHLHLPGKTAAAAAHTVVQHGEAGMRNVLAASRGVQRFLVSVVFLLPFLCLGTGVGEFLTLWIHQQICW